MTTTPLVYGLALEQLPRGVSDMCGVSAGDVPVVRIDLLPGAAYEGDDQIDLRVDEDSAVLRMPEGWLEVAARDPELTIRYCLDRPLIDEALVHPYLAFPAAVVSHWLGRVALHAGCMIVDGVAIAILGSKGAGKSSTMAAAARAGFDVLCDDLLVLDAGNALAGPRAIDLRADASATLGGRYLGVVGARERWRVPLEPVAASAPLRAIVTLGWDDHIEARPLAPRDRVAPLLAACALDQGWLSPDAAFDLFDLPAWEVVRPRDLTGVDECVETIASLVRG